MHLHRDEDPVTGQVVVSLVPQPLCPRVFHVIEVTSGMPLLTFGGLAEVPDVVRRLGPDAWVDVRLGCPYDL